MGYSDFDEIEVKNILSVEEVENEFILVVTDDKKPTHLYLNETNFIELLEKLKPFFDEYRAEEEFKLNGDLDFLGDRGV